VILHTFVCGYHCVGGMFVIIYKTLHGIITQKIIIHVLFIMVAKNLILIELALKSCRKNATRKA
jgi:hypothetical protein